MMNQAQKTAVSERRRISLRRRILYSLVPLLGLLAVLEIGARVVDARIHFRARLLGRLALKTAGNQPVGDDVDLSWPPGTLLVRSRNESTEPGEAYSVGGRLVLSDMQTPVADLVTPDDIVREDTRRVFVVGGSAAFGYPYTYWDAISEQLEILLLSRGFRVWNAAQVGSSSGGLVPVVRRIVDGFEPEALVVFTGNNEWYQWEPGTAGDAGAVRLLRFLAHSRALAALESWWLGRAPLAHGSVDDDGTGFRPEAEIAGSSYALEHPLDDPDFDPQEWLRDKRRYLEAFEDHLTTLVTLAREKNVRVVLLTVPFNYRLSPAWKHPQPRWFDPEHREALVAAHTEAGDLLAEGRYREAKARIEAALALDPLPPVLNYMLGECLEKMAEPWAAEEAYARCRENMIGNLGSCLSVNEVIARVAAANDVTLIDVKRLFDEYGREHWRPFNQDLIKDDCHPTPEGHHIIAKALAKVLAE